VATILIGINCSGRCVGYHAAMQRGVSNASGARPGAGAACLRRLLGAAGAWLSGPAHASFFSGEALDTAADVLAWVVLVIVPIIGIVVFWLVHVLPEKIAHRRHHPQRDAIQTLCLLSLVFGGMLWPLAWLWAYTRPTAYRQAYGTEKHDDYYAGIGRRAAAGEVPPDERVSLLAELDAIERTGPLSPAQRIAREALGTTPTAPAAAPAGRAAGSA